MEATGKGLVELWDWASEKGLMNKNTASSLRAACSGVLSVLDNWETADVSKVDVEELFKRFQNLNAERFTPESLMAYKRRFKQALKSYLEYVKDQSAWKPHVQDRPMRPRRNGDERQDETPGTPVPAASRSQARDERLVEYPFPLREGQIVLLKLPHDLKAAEVKRLTAFIAALAVDFEPA